MKQALFYTTAEDGSVRCHLCRHRCNIYPGKRGICKVRENRDGELYSLVYGTLVSEQVDPIEKKPLYHVLPGSLTCSIASVGCNFHCEHCQNCSIAQVNPTQDGMVPRKSFLPEKIVSDALAAGCTSIAYTYTEPTVWGEYVLDVARLAAQAGLKNILVTNGYITPEALDPLAPYIDAANIDLKGFSEEFYQRIVGAKLSETLACIEDYFRRGIWIELTTLIIPGENDSERQLVGIAEFIAKKLSQDVPWHISRFFPSNRMINTASTPRDSLERAVSFGRAAGLKHIYVGNCTDGDENTYCPGCGKLLIERRRFTVVENRLKNGRCFECNTTIAGLW